MPFECGDGGIQIPFRVTFRKIRQIRKKEPLTAKSCGITDRKPSEEAALELPPCVSLLDFLKVLKVELDERRSNSLFGTWGGVENVSSAKNRTRFGDLLDQTRLRLLLLISFWNRPDFLPVLVYFRILRHESKHQQGIGLTAGTGSTGSKKRKESMKLPVTIPTHDNQYKPRPSKTTGIMDEISGIPGCLSASTFEVVTHSTS
ncbi:uncharacterized protein EI90DRAFT_3016080 [Cantharellus anzutake]|uniref:uncharacterized protein n=1 Tax=Cantharellus anzutake TaxID=1750568 RepID=UPI001904A59B|nr:uncharacterized protein EI90DRAFT_3016080 [Cantharellus anzutake]KAF8331962.1 hypothetical protein EI90DRAFT_3016080 [Cantharellus anzutake]